jgi:hypothetical protein
MNQIKSRQIICAAAAGLLSVAGVRVANAQAVQQVGDVFYIAMENHNWTQPSSLNGSINPIFGDTAAAPYINSLVTPGNANAANTAYATSYYNAGTGEHPSEPNYVWQEAGTNFNPNLTGTLQTTGHVNVATSTTQGTISGTTILNDNDSSAASGNIFPTSFANNHLTGQLNTAGISWKNYQEDYQITNNTTPTGGSPTVSKSGTSTTVQNPYNGSFQYNYAEKHNPMAYFADTATQNVEQMSQLSTDLTNNTVGRYNWITPNQYNDMHSALTGGFTYHGTAFTGDQAMIAQGDNFLSIVVPQIEASAAWQNNGAIVIWNDETEGGDTTAETSMEIVISKLAKGNAYADPTVLSHSSDVKSMEELFGLSQIDNAIPTSETFAAGGYATVQGANDLSNLFVPGAITGQVPEPTTLGLIGVGAVAMIGRRNRRKA